ncbi:hypothetical protein ACFFKU_06690 [Kineococcus gynurae]|uniref:Uncharacterized protein n=1 Tax=Kineococcus gynurae TaxID=452979 RepID=A0ABV5LX19_9ACTN
MRTTSTRQRTRPSRAARPVPAAAVRHLPRPADVELPSGPVPEKLRATVTIPALRATVAEWLAAAADGTAEPRSLELLAATAHVDLRTLATLLRPGARGSVEAGIAARLLWAMGEPLRPDLCVALVAELAAEERAA